MKRHFFRRTFITYFTVLLLSIVFIETYVTAIVRENYLNGLRHSLSIQAGLISENIPFKSAPNLDGLCRELKEKTGARVTVINAEGRVLGDSDNDSSLMENHADRPEIQQAIISGTGSAVRFSSTIDADLLYIAERVPRGKDTAGFVRLAVPLKEINSAVNALRLKINLAVILIFLASALILAWRTERIRRFTNLITEYSGALAHGLFIKKLYLEDAGEFTELAHNLNNMAGELEETIRTKGEETNRLATILKNIPDALLLINLHGIIELSNTAAREIFGHNQLEGKQYLEIIRDPSFSSLMDDVLRDRSPGSAELILDTPSERHLSVRVSPLSYTVGEAAGVVAIFHDTTQMKRLEQMRKDFVANVSHEIRTPVTSIKGFAETLLDGALYDKENAEKFLNTIKTHSERLNRLVDDLLTISRLELGVLTVNKSEFHIADVIDEVIQATVIHAAGKELTIKSSVDKGEALINADRDRLTQILLNLTDNAVKFTDKGEIEIGIAQDGKGNYFYVKDTGIGVPEKYVQRLGERFFRVDPSRSRQMGGTGLGLAIVKHIVKAHGWEMKIESKEGKGTVVKVYY